MRNSKLFLIAALIQFFAFSSMAQFDVNLKYGAHMSSVHTKDAFNSIDAIKTPVTGHFIETTIGYDLSESFNISTGVSYKRKGFGLEYTTDQKILGLSIPLGIRTELDVKALSIPIKLKYNLPIPSIESYAFAGGGYTFHLDSRANASANIIGNIDIAQIPTNNLINNGESFAHIGIGLATNAGGGKIFGEISYEHSLQNYTSELIIDVPIRNRGITVGVGYSMPF